MNSENDFQNALSIREVWNFIYNDNGSFSKYYLFLQKVAEKNLKIITSSPGKQLSEDEFMELTSVCLFNLYKAICAKPISEVDNPDGYTYIICKNEFSKFIRKFENTPVVTFIAKLKKALKDLENSNQLVSNNQKYSATEDGLDGKLVLDLFAIRDRLIDFEIVYYKTSMVWTQKKYRELQDMIIKILEDGGSVWFNDLQTGIAEALDIRTASLLSTDNDSEQPSPETKISTVDDDLMIPDADPERLINKEYEKIEASAKEQIAQMASNPKDSLAVILGYEYFVKGLTMKKIAIKYGYKRHNNVDHHLKKFKDSFLSVQKKKVYSMCEDNDELRREFAHRFLLMLENYIPKIVEIKQ